MTLLKVKQVAERLNLSPSKVYELIDEEKLPHYRIGGTLRVSDVHLAEFLASNEHGTGEKAKAWPARTKPKLQSGGRDWF